MTFLQRQPIFPTGGESHKHLKKRDVSLERLAHVTLALLRGLPDEVIGLSLDAGFERETMATPMNYE